MYGIVGNPVSHSRSPALHNAALAAAGMDAVYVPLLVDELRPFLDAFPSFSGFSITIPHKVPLSSPTRLSHMTLIHLLVEEVVLYTSAHVHKEQV